MELRNVKTFLYVAEQRSFSKAADILGYAQSTVTTQIQQLEQEFNTLLFERIHKSVRLTAAGEEFLNHAKALLRTVEDASAAMKRLPEESGQLRVAMADSLCTGFFTEILNTYHKQYPQVEVRVMTGGTDDLFEMLARNEADMVYTLDQRIYSSELVTAMEKETEVLFVVSPEHPAAGQVLTFEELVKQDFLLTEKGMSYRKYLEQYLASQSLELKPFLEMGNVEIIRALVEKGMGMSFLPEYTVRKSIDNGLLSEVKVQDYHFRIWRQLIYHKNKWVTPGMQAMIRSVSCEDAGFL